MTDLRVEHRTDAAGGGTDWLFVDGVEVGSVTWLPDGAVGALPAEREFAVADVAAGLRLLRQIDAVAGAGGDLEAAIAALKRLRGEGD